MDADFCSDPRFRWILFMAALARPRGWTRWYPRGFSFWYVWQAFVIYVLWQTPVLTLLAVTGIGGSDWSAHVGIEAMPEGRSKLIGGFWVVLSVFYLKCWFMLRTMVRAATHIDTKHLGRSIDYAKVGVREGQDGGARAR